MFVCNIIYMCVYVDTFCCFFSAAAKPIPKICLLLRFHCSFYGLNILLFNVVCSFFLLFKKRMKRKKEIRIQYLQYNSRNLKTESLKPSNIVFIWFTNLFMPIVGRVEFSCCCCCSYAFFSFFQHLNVCHWNVHTCAKYIERKKHWNENKYPWESNILIFC